MKLQTKSPDVKSGSRQPTQGRLVGTTSGFGLIELLVALAIVALLWGGVKYFKQYQTETGNALSGAEDAKRQAEQAKALIEARYKQ